MLLASFAKQSELGRVLITKATTTTKHGQARLISVKRVYLCHGKGKERLVSLRSVITRSGPLIKPELFPVSESCIDKEYFYSSLDGILVHHKVTSYSPVPSYTPGWREAL